MIKMKAKKISQEVYFGNVENEFRGTDKSKLMNPPMVQKDDYFWMRDDNRTNEEVLNVVKEENEYTESIMKPYEKLQEELYNEIKSYMKEDYHTYPTSIYSDISKYRYYKEFKKGLGYYVYHRVNIESNEDTILLDINELAKGYKQCDVTSLSHNKNETLFSYCMDNDGSEKYALKIMNIEKNEYISTTDSCPLISYGTYKWVSNDSILYIKTDEANRPYQLWLWNINETNHKLVYEESIKDIQLGFSVSDDNNYLFITSGSYNSSQTRYISVIDLLEYKFENMKCMSSIIENFKYEVTHYNGIFYILNNGNKSVNWRISYVNVEESCNIENWKDLISHNENVYIENIMITMNHLIYMSKINGNSYINIYNFESKEVIKTNGLMKNDDEIPYTLDIHSYNYDADYIYIGSDGLTRPYSIKKMNLNNINEEEIVYIKEVPNYDATLYESKRVYINNDNVKIPVSLVYKKDIDIKNAPLYLYGYGSYGIIVEPHFNFKIISLLNRGYVYAIAHVRGGAFLGYNWYLDGKMYNKMNTFKDFIACSEGLPKIGYGDSDLITIDGRSAGGLLVGASMTMRPDLYKNVIMGVPFVDVLNTMCDSTIPLTVEEWTQWGNPNMKEDYEYIKQYCPYTNIKEAIYPNIYITAGLYDPRVQYWEPLKFINKLKGYKKDNNIQIIKIGMEQGHFGGSNRYKYLEEEAERQTFILR